MTESFRDVDFDDIFCHFSLNVSTSISLIGAKRNISLLKNEPAHEIMALIALRKLSLQTRMRSNPLGLMSDI